MSSWNRGRYQVDVYVFSAVDNSLRMRSEYYHYSGNVPTSLASVREFPTITAPTRWEDLWRFRGNPGDVPGNNQPGGARLLLYGASVPGQIQMRLMDTTVTVPTAASANLVQIGQAIVSAINASSPLQARGIVAALLPADVGLTVLDLANIHESDISIILNQNQGRLNILHPGNVPQMTLSRVGGQDFLQLPAATTTGFKLQLGSWSGPNLQWTNAPFPPGTVTNGAQITVPIATLGPVQLYRLMLGP